MKSVPDEYFTDDGQIEPPQSELDRRWIEADLYWQKMLSLRNQTITPSKITPAKKRKKRRNPKWNLNARTSKLVPAITPALIAQYDHECILSMFNTKELFDRTGLGHPDGYEIGADSAPEALRRGKVMTSRIGSAG